MGHSVQRDRSVCDACAAATNGLCGFPKITSINRLLGTRLNLKVGTLRPEHGYVAYVHFPWTHVVISRKSSEACSTPSLPTLRTAAGLARQRWHGVWNWRVSAAKAVKSNARTGCIRRSTDRFHSLHANSRSNSGRGGSDVCTRSGSRAGSGLEGFKMFRADFGLAYKFLKIVFTVTMFSFVTLLGLVSHAFWEGESGEEISTRWNCVGKITTYATLDFSETVSLDLAPGKNGSKSGFKNKNRAWARFVAWWEKGATGKQSLVAL